MITPYGKVVLVDIPLRRAGIGITYAKAREVVDQRWRSLLKNYGGAQCGY
jgi:hypothetical protein